MSTDRTPAFRLDGQTALVTGASRGLGRHFARLLASAGARLVLAARRTDRLEELVAELLTAGHQAHAIALDVSDPASVVSGLDATCRMAVPDIVVSNAGVAITRPLLEQTLEDWDTVIDTNLRGCWLVAQEAARRWVDGRRPGCIVNVGSITGERVVGGVAPYAVSKAGVIHATKAMALELARHDIRVNALLPGYVRTELNADWLDGEAGRKLLARIPGRRFLEPSDLDGPLLLLVSSAGKAMSGAVLAVDRGHLVSSL